MAEMKTVDPAKEGISTKKKEVMERRKREDTILLCNCQVRHHAREPVILEAT